MTIKAVLSGYTGEREDNMSRVEIMKKAIKVIRTDMSVINDYKKENRFELYDIGKRVIDNELFFLLKMNVINYKQYQWLSRKIIKDSQ